MGAGPSKQPTDAEQTVKNYADIAKELENAEAFVSDGVQKNLKLLGDILTDYNKNDTQGILDKIMSNETLKAEIPDTILNKVSDVHKNVLNNLDNTLTEADKKRQLETDENLAAYIQRFVDKDLDVKMKEYLQNPFIQGDPVVARSMTDVTNSIKTIRGKYKYFEYKYVQMNIFLIMFTKHVHEVIKRFIDDTAGFYAAKEKYHLVLIQNVIKTFQEQLGDETKKMTNLDTKDFSSAVSTLTQSIMDSISQQRTISEKMKSDSLAEILRYLMQRETEFANEIIKGVDDYKESPSYTASKKNKYIPAEHPEDYMVLPNKRVESNWYFTTIDQKAGWRQLDNEADRKKYISYEPYYFYNKNKNINLQNYTFRDGRFGYGYYNVRSSWGPNDIKNRFTLRFIEDNPDWLNRAKNHPWMVNSTKIQTIEDIERLKRTPSLPSSQRGYVDPRYPLGAYGRRQSFPPGMRGGFVRDNSLLPQKFYDLDGGCAGSCDGQDGDVDEVPGAPLPSSSKA